MTITHAATTDYESPVGTLRLRAGDAGLTGCHVRRGPARSVSSTAASPVLRRAVRELDEYFAGDRERFEVPVDWSASSLPDEYVRILTALPGAVGFGARIGYAELARALDVLPDGTHPSAAQRVGAAMAANPVLIVIPCHRVVGARGALTGFAAGLDAKRRLLDHERGQGSLDLLTLAGSRSST